MRTRAKKADAGLSGVACEGNRVWLESLFLIQKVSKSESSLKGVAWARMGDVTYCWKSMDKKEKFG